MSGYCKNLTIWCLDGVSSITCVGTPDFINSASTMPRHIGPSLSQFRTVLISTILHAGIDCTVSGHIGQGLNWLHIWLQYSCLSLQDITAQCLDTLEQVHCIKTSNCDNSACHNLLHNVWTMLGQVQTVYHPIITFLSAIHYRTVSGHIAVSLHS